MSEMNSLAMAAAGAWILALWPVWHAAGRSILHIMLIVGAIAAIVGIAAFLC